MDVFDNLHELDRFFDLALDHLVVAGFDGYFKRLSRAWTTTLGWTEEELRSRPVIDFVHPDDRVGVLAGRHGLMNGVPLVGLVNRYRCKDGSYRWFEWRSIGYPERQLVYAVARDITEKKLLEAERESSRAQLVVSERMASLGRLAAGVAHEINNPLAFVLSNARMALADLRAGAPTADQLRELQEMLEDALEGAERVQRVVQGLLTLAGGERERRVPLAVRDSVELALSLLAPELRRSARVIEIHADAPRVVADEARLGQALVSLLQSASEALPRGDPAEQEIRVRTGTDGRGWALVEIEDSGPAIPAEALARVFEPFSSPDLSRRTGGLRLSICRTLVSALGGELTVASGGERGAIFRVALPPEPPAAA